MTKNSFYIISNEFFDFAKDPYLKDNKDEKRPFYYCLEDQDGLFWMIPLSSRVEKYRALMEIRKAKHKPNDGLYICKLPSDKSSVFLIQDMFPITEKYIEREYTLNGNHLCLVKEVDIKNIYAKAKKVKKLIERGVKITPTSPDILALKNKLLSKWSIDIIS